MKPLRPLQLHGLTQVYCAVASSSSSSDHEAWEKFVGRSIIIIIRSRCLEKVRGPQHRARHHRRHLQITRLGKGSWAAASCSSSSLSSSDHEDWEWFAGRSIVLAIITIMIQPGCLEKVRGPQHRARHHRRHHQITKLGKGSWAAASCS